MHSLRSFSSLNLSYSSSISFILIVNFLILFYFSLCSFKLLLFTDTNPLSFNNTLICLSIYLLYLFIYLSLYLYLSVLRKVYIVRHSELETMNYFRKSKFLLRQFGGIKNVCSKYDVDEHVNYSVEDKNLHLSES